MATTDDLTSIKKVHAAMVTVDKNQESEESPYSGGSIGNNQ